MLSSQTLEVFCDFLGSIVGDLVMMYGAQGVSIWPEESCHSCVSRCYAVTLSNASSIKAPWVRHYSTSRCG